MATFSKIIPFSKGLGLRLVSSAAARVEAYPRFAKAYGSLTSQPHVSASLYSAGKSGSFSPTLDPQVPTRSDL